MGSERRRMRKIHTSGKSCRKWGTLGFLATGLFAFFSTATFAQQKTDTPVQLHPQNPHYFLFHGKAMALIGSGEHYGAVFNGDFDYHNTADARSGGDELHAVVRRFLRRNAGKVIRDLAERPCSAPGRFVAPWARTDTAGYAGGGNKFDLSKWNPEYFQRLHDFLEEANRRGVVVEITLFSSQYADVQWNLSPFKRENNVNSTDEIDWKKLNTLENGNILGYQERYTRKLVREASTYPTCDF